ncbi:MAG: hypothetical protein QXT81_05695 [Candidatus Bathyarchaeia archaeon]
MRTSIDLRLEDMQEDLHIFTVLGLILIAIGFILVMLPFIARQLPALGKLPPIVWWTYRTDNFYFATSPILIIISIISILIFFLGRYFR